MDGPRSMWSTSLRRVSWSSRRTVITAASGLFVLTLMLAGVTGGARTEQAQVTSKNPLSQLTKCHNLDRFAVTKSVTTQSR